MIRNKLISNCAVTAFGLFLLTSVSLAQKPAPAPVDLKQFSQQAEFDRLTREIQAFSPTGPGRERIEKETLRHDALILAEDKTPVDVILRRTKALAVAIGGLAGAPDLAAERQQLETLASQNQAGLKPAQQKELFFKICDVRRQIAFKNPLLTFKDIAFLTHYKQFRGERHMVDQYFGFNAQPGGGLYVLKNAFSDKPEVVDLLKDSVVESGRLKGQKLANGSFVGLDLDFDGKTMAFAWTQAQSEFPDEKSDWSQQHWSKEECFIRGKNYWQYYWKPERCYHIFKVNADGSGLAQLTDGPWDEFDPCFLPNGRMVFISQREASNGRCHARWCPTATLHGMMRDGSDVIALSWHETNEWAPSVDNNGMIVYTRWDYVDREANQAHHMWSCYPDGRDPRSLHGNYPDDHYQRPNMELAIRAIPGSSKYIAVAAPHHGQNYGSMIMIDPTVADDRATSQVRRITPEVRFPEHEALPGVPRRVKGQKEEVKSSGPCNSFGQPWPLNEDFYLCVYDANDGQYALTLADSFGNRIALYRDAEVPCLDPIPFVARPTPPVIPVMTQQAKVDRKESATPNATVAIMNVYEAEKPLPAGVKITGIRVVNLFPKDTPIGGIPNIGSGQALARGVLGTAPVESDGSAYFELPAGAEVYFQALDEKGCAVMSMRSGTYAHPGERLTCMGCHESKLRSASHGNYNQQPIAMQRPPSKLAPEPVGSWPLSYPRLVQPVLDAKCVGCHQKNPKSPDLTGNLYAPIPVPASLTAEQMAELQKGKHPEDAGKRWQLLAGVTHEQQGWSKSYCSLRGYAWFANMGMTYSLPGQVGAHASRLLPLLEKGHHDVVLTAEEWRRLVVWLDCNSCFFGAYKDLEKQARGELVLPRVGFPENWKEYVR